MSNAKTRIFCVITQGETGGAQRFVSQLANNIDLERFDMHVVWGSAGKNTLDHMLPHQVTSATVEHLVRSISPWNDFKALFELRREMLDYRPDVVLCISSKAGFIGALAARPLRAALPHLQVVYRIGGWTFNDPWPAYKKKIYIWLERLSARWKDTIVVNNTHDFEQARRLRISPRKELVRIYNGLDPFMPFMPRDEARALLDERASSSVAPAPYDWLVGTIANLYPTKDILTLVRAASRVGGNVRFVVIGDGEQRKAVDALIGKLNLRDRFLLLGSIKDASRYMAAFDVLALPSVKEGFPWAVLEAMAAKVPVVATRVGAIPEMLDDGISGIICEPGDAEQLAQGIVKLLGDDRLRQDYAIAAHQHVINAFSLREMIDQYERLFTVDDTSI
jgi:glycosyltransferase involved in cell wall biosynthesis